MTDTHLTDSSRTPGNPGLERGWSGGLSSPDRDILDERARAFASRHGDRAGQAKALRPFIAVRLSGAEHYGITYDHLDEILANVDITSVPCAPAHVVGVTSRRGELLTVVDLAEIVGAEPAPHEQATNHIVVVSGGDITMGLSVHEVLGYDEYDPLALQPPIRTDNPCFDGIWARTVTMLNIQSLLNDAALVVDDHPRPTDKEST